MHNRETMDVQKPERRFAGRIYVIRGRKVVLARDLAALFGVTTAAVNGQIRRDRNLFPEERAFRLTREEFRALLRQIAAPNPGSGGRTWPPWVLTEDGVVMLSTLLRNGRTVAVNRMIDWGAAGEGTASDR